MIVFMTLMENSCTEFQDFRNRKVFKRKENKKFSEIYQIGEFLYIEDQKNYGNLGKEQLFCNVE